MRCSPLKYGKPLERKTSMARRTVFKSPTAGAGLLRVAAVQVKARAPAREAPKLLKQMAPRDMRGRS